jgi:hypothetical protein
MKVMYTKDQTKTLREMAKCRGSPTVGSVNNDLDLLEKHEAQPRGHSMGKGQGYDRYGSCKRHFVADVCVQVLLGAAETPVVFM